MDITLVTFQDLSAGETFRFHPKAEGYSTKIEPQPHSYPDEPRFDKCRKCGATREVWINAIGDDGIHEHVCPDRVVYQT